jgi:hypothetical protein
MYHRTWPKEESVFTVEGVGDKVTGSYGTRNMALSSGNVLNEEAFV